jgi:4-hydroxy-tetrahydrodipicolinate reductase
MRLGLVGTGKMGREISRFAPSRGHEIAWALSRSQNEGGRGLTPEKIGSADVVLEFTSPEAACANLLPLAAAGARVVCGTTGWQKDLPGITKAFERSGGTLVHATNFSIGVRLFYEVAQAAASLFPGAGYASYLVEEHHAGKKDAPSGTARTIADLVKAAGAEAPPIASVRAGGIPGYHRLVFESPEDEVELIHRARGRAGFAKGALWAAERIGEKKGVFEFGDLLREAQ